MTPQERQAALELVTIPGRGRALSPRRFLKRVGAKDGRRWAADQVVDAVRRQDGDDLEAALIARSVFGGDRSSHQALVEALGARWHQVHESIVAAVEELASPADVPALVSVTSWVPDYLEFDESRALARKAIHAVAAIPGDEAASALERLAGHEDDELARLAVRVLDRRSA